MTLDTFSLRPNRKYLIHFHLKSPAANHHDSESDFGASDDAPPPARNPLPDERGGDRWPR